MASEGLPIRLSDARLDPDYVSQVCGRRYNEGEKRLMLAVLQEALNNFVQFRAAKDLVGQERFREVERWFFDQKTDWLYSFNSICENLGISSSYFLVGLRRLKGAKASALHPSGSSFKPFRVCRIPHRTRYTGLAKERSYSRARPTRGSSIAAVQ
jgi:hypothetical protein